MALSRDDLLATYAEVLLKAGPGAAVPEATDVSDLDRARMEHEMRLNEMEILAMERLETAKLEVERAKIKAEQMEKDRAVEIEKLGL